MRRERGRMKERGERGGKNAVGGRREKQDEERKR